MADQSLLDVLRPLLPAAPDPDADIARLLAGLFVPDPAAQAGTATPVPGETLDFVFTGGGLSLRAAQSVPAGLQLAPGVWEWPGQVQYTLVAPQGQLDQLKLDLGSLAARLPFLRGAELDNGSLQPDPANPAVRLRFSGASLMVTVAPDGTLQSTLSLGNATASPEPAFVLVGPLDFVGFGLSGAALAPGGAAEVLELQDVQLFAQPPGIPALALQATAQTMQLNLGANPGVSGNFEIDMAEQAAGAGHLHFLNGLSWQVRLDHNTLSSFEVRGQMDFQAAVERKLGGALPGVQAQPADFELAVTFDQGEWRAALHFGAGATPEDGLVTSQRNGSPAANGLLDILGVMAAFAPLLNPGPPDPGHTPQAGDYLDLAVTPALAAGVLGSGLLQVAAVTLQGGELVTRKLPSGAYEAIFQLDLQTDLEVKARLPGLPEPIVESTPGRPLRVRHQAMGLRLEFGDDPEQPVFHPVFDPGKGYTLEVSDPGMFKVPGPLGDILQVLGVRLARTNPLNLEIDLGLPADLGVVSVDRARLRIPLDPPGVPSLTALGAGVDVGAVKGKGYLSINSQSDGTSELSGGLDASLVPLGLRVAATLKLAQLTNPAATGVLVTLEVNFPIPLPLYATGLGLFGLAGLFAMHYKRNEDDNQPQPALDWFEHKALGDPTNTKGSAWEVDRDHWAFGVGAVLGTMEGGFVLNMNGMLIVEVPGPRLLIFMGARLLLPRPGTKEKTPGNLLAVIDVGPKDFRIGLTAEYGIPPIYEVRVPVGAVFPYPDDTDKFEVDLGSIKDPVTVKYLFVFRGTGYLMIHGDGIQNFPLGDLHGFSVAVGAHAEIIWGSEDIGLYLKVAAGLDVGVSFKPFLILGRMSLSGELHLFIAGLEVSAQADVKVVQKSDNLTDFDYYVKADVCGKIDFLLDSIEGCVTIELGNEPALPDAPALVRAVSLHSRTPARLQGSGVDRAIDGSLGDAAPTPNPDLLTKPVVPIDAIPVIQFEMPPVVDQVVEWPFGEQPKNRPTLAPSGWTRRGERFYRYTLQSIRLEGPVGSGDKPSVWWSRHALPEGDDNDVQLALLNWTPDPTPQAALRTIHQERSVTRRWGTVCLPIVEPTPVLWSLHQTPLGTSSSGWQLTGLPLPDPAGATRSAPPPLSLKAVEAWRTGDTLADALLSIIPARVIAPNVLLPGRLLTAPSTPFGLRMEPDHPELTPLVDAAVAQAFPNGLPLDDALRLEGVELRSMRLLVWMMDTTLNENFTLRALDAAGNELEAPLPFDVQVIHQASDWLPPGHAWFDRVDQALKQAQALDLSPAFLLSADLPDGAAILEMGLRDMDEFQHERLKEFPAPYLLLALEGLPVAEFLRVDYDETTKHASTKMLDGYLGADPSKQALLLPGRDYRVVVAYTVEVGAEADPEDPNIKDYAEAPNNQNRMVKVKPVATQNPPALQFEFSTDHLPPRRLDPWILTVQPGEGEGFHFWGDPIQVVFSTNAVRQLYAAYNNRKLRGVVRAASFRHAAGAPTHLQTATLLEPTAALAALTPQTSAVLPPFEESLRLALRDQDCVPGAHTLPLSQEKWDLNLLLDPLTDYVFDIECEPALPPASGQPVRPLYRRSFTTSRYKNLAEMIAAIAGVPLRHRRLANPVPLTDLAAAPGAGTRMVRELDFEMALRHAGWGDLRLPATPEVTVIWDDQVPAQPVGVLLNLPEPLWRWRQTPEKHINPDDPLKTESYLLKQQAWLELVESGGPVARGIAYTPGGGRSLVVLQPNARGGSLNLAVRRTRVKLLDGADGVDNLPLRSLPLAQAPWEIE